MKWVSLLLVVIGIGVLAFPSLENQYMEKKQTKLVDQYEQHLSPDSQVATQSLEDVTDVFESEPQAATAAAPLPNEMMGTLEIPSIELNLPILEGATEESLASAVGHLTGTPFIGQEGNASLAGHRGYSFGRLFNRLDELEKGDTILATTEEGPLQYEVTDVFLVKPEDVSVLEPFSKGSTITLITCHPIRNPTHRIIVQAELVKHTPSSS